MHENSISEAIEIRVNRREKDKDKEIIRVFEECLNTSKVQFKETFNVGVFYYLFNHLALFSFYLTGLLFYLSMEGAPKF